MPTTSAADVPSSSGVQPLATSPISGWLYLLHIYFYRINIMTAVRWLARVQHDLVKRLLWPARDRRELGGDAAPGELVAPLIDDQGAPTSAAALWAALLAEWPGQAGPARAGAASPDGPALARFADALERALAAGQAGDVAGVLALESAFAELARSLDEPSE
jgi:hypothetical protein